MDKKQFEGFQKKAADKVRGIVTNPFVVKTSKAANGFLDIASKLGQSNMPGVLPKVGAGISVLDTVVRNFDLEPKSPIKEFISENNLVHAHSALGMCIFQIGAIEQLGFDALASGKKEALVGTRIDGKIFAVKLQMGLNPKPTYNCYYSKEFDFASIKDKLWDLIGESAEITWNDRDWRPDLIPSVLRVSDRVDSEIQKEVRENIELYAKAKVSYAALLYGPPGTGKTTFIHTLAKNTNRKVITIRPDVIDRFEPQNIEVIFDALQPGIILLDDVDRAEDGLVKLMSFLETIRDRYPNIAILSTCNGFPENSALMRPGRLGEIVEFKSPTDEKKKALLKHYMKEYNAKIEEYNLDELVAEMTTLYFSHDYVRQVAEKTIVANQEKLLRWTKNLNMQIKFMNGENINNKKKDV